MILPNLDKWRWIRAWEIPAEAVTDLDVELLASFVDVVEAAVAQGELNLGDSIAIEIINVDGSAFRSLEFRIDIDDYLIPGFGSMQ